MIRLLLLFLSLPLLSSCIAKKKVEAAAAAYESRITALDSVAVIRQDSMLDLRLALERQRGSNDALLVTQDRLQDRLATQEDELDELRGNLTSTNSQARRQLADMKAEVSSTKAMQDSLLAMQKDIIRGFQVRTDLISDQLFDSLETMLPPSEYSVRSQPGMVTLSIQEDAFFGRRSSNSIAPASAPLFQTIAAILAADPLIKLTVTGHTDNGDNPKRGTDNREFAALRAAAVVRILADEYFISPNRIAAASEGEFSPARSNADEEGRRFNRRIDFVFVNNVANFVRQLNRINPEEK